jgi:hypothetical protein
MTREQDFASAESDASPLLPIALLPRTYFYDQTGVLHVDIINS